LIKNTNIAAKSCLMTTFKTTKWKLIPIFGDFYSWVGFEHKITIKVINNTIIKRDYFTWDQ